ncbi:MAG: hypothetical protein KC505_10080 [Myxococcales bacterium]|nr:hypothetical protein [Myxococcales bacterium]USN49847.1 MAG: hypothetical protein H6731_06090 [Myxococcales bacterium]
MAFASEEVTKSWRKKKGLIIKSRPRQSNFSLAVCFSIILALLGGFLGGFITAGIALGENYGAVYEGLISELETTRQCVEREKNELKSLREAHLARANIDSVHSMVDTNFSNSLNNNQIKEQALMNAYQQENNLIQR